VNTYDLLADLRAILKEAVAGNWSDSDLIKCLDYSYQVCFGRQVSLGEDVVITRSLADVVSGTQEYSLPTNTRFLVGLEHKLDTRYLPLRPISYRERWRFENGIPSMFYKIANVVGICPAPTESVADGLRFVFIPVPGKLHTGLALEGTAASIMLAADASSQDDIYNDMQLEVVAGTGVGQVVTITDYTGSTREAAAVFATTPDETSRYAIVPKTDSVFDQPMLFLAASMACTRLDAQASSQFHAMAKENLHTAALHFDVRNREPQFIRPYDDPAVEW
jgi:hypothetical protein